MTAIKSESLTTFIGISTHAVKLIRREKVSRNLPPPEVRARLVRIRLLMNILIGKDAAVQSAKLLGQDREANLFEVEATVGISSLVLALPGNRLILPTSPNSNHARLPKRHHQGNRFTSRMDLSLH